MEVEMLRQVIFKGLIQNFAIKGSRKKQFFLRINVSFVLFQKIKFYFTVYYCFYFELRMVKKMDVARFILKQLNEEEVKEQYQVTIKNKFAALENLDDNGNINRAWETIRENIRISAKESIGLCELKSY
jgi:hypothetical protein